MDIEKEIKKILIDKDMTVSDLAEELGTSKQNLNIKLKRKDMMLSYFNKILNVLGFKIAIVKDTIKNINIFKLYKIPLIFKILLFNIKKLSIK